MERRGSRLSRRTFVLGAGSVTLLAGCGRLPWQAQTPPAQVGRAARIGFLSPNNPTRDPHVVAAFEQGLRDYGYVVGQNLRIEYRYAEGAADRLPGLAAELVDLNLDVIVAYTTPAALAVK